MAKLLAYFFEIEMFKATITRIVEKNHYQITSAFDIVELRWYFLFPVGFSVYFTVIASNNLQKSSAIQKISVILSSVIIAIFVCNYLYFNTLKLQQISLITKFIDTYNSSNSRYLDKEQVFVLSFGYEIKTVNTLRLYYQFLNWVQAPKLP